MRNDRGTIELARRLCVEVAGTPDIEGDDYVGNGYGSIDVAEILSGEVLRLRQIIYELGGSIA